jgi:hypothetical protein
MDVALTLSQPVFPVKTKGGNQHEQNPRPAMTKGLNDILNK